MILLQLKADVVHSGFISVSYLGKFVEYGRETVTIEDACVIYEMAITDDDKVTRLKSQYSMNGQDRKSTRLNSSHIPLSRMPSSA